MSETARTRRIAAAVAEHGPRGLLRIVGHGVGWRWRRQLSRSQARGGVLYRLVKDLDPPIGPPAPTPEEELRRAARTSMRGAERRLKSMPSPILSGLAEPELATVGIVVPAYGNGALLARALQRVVDQTYPHWRCVVVDDGSPGDIGATVEPFRVADRRVQLLRHGANGGAAAAWNTGLRQLDTDLVVFLPTDGLLLPTALQHAVESFKPHWRDPAVAGVHGHVLQLPEGVELADVAGLQSVERRGIVDWTGYRGDCPFDVHGALVRRALVDAAGGFDEDLGDGLAAWDLWLRLLRHGYRFEPNQHVVGAIRLHPAATVGEDRAARVGGEARLFAAAEQWASLDPALVVGRGGAAPLDRTKLAIERAMRAASAIAEEIADTGSYDPLTESDAFDILDCPLPGGSWDGVVEAACDGAARGLGLSRRVAELLSPVARDKILRIGHAVAEEIDRRAAEPARQKPDFDATSRRAPVDVLFVAESVADVAALRPMAAAAAQRRPVAAADLEVIAGAGGANDAWRDAGIGIVPYHHAVAGVSELSDIVACLPAGPVAADLLAAAERAGARRHLVRVPGRPASLPCHPSASLEASAASPAEVEQALAAPRADPRPPSRLGSGWRGSRFPARLPAEDGPIEPASIERLAGLRGRHEGETAVIIGNGPSLNDTELEILTDVPTFGVNAVFLAADRFPQPISYFVVEDTSVFSENLAAIKAFDAECKLFPVQYRPSLDDAALDERTIFFRMNGGFYDRGTGTACHPRFSFDPTQRLYCGQSVTIINLQLAHWMGFRRVVLIGMDFSYRIPDDADRDGSLITSRSDDPNHFHPDYFGAGKSWKDPRLDRVLVSYHLADEVYRATGREIVNATEGGKLDLFPRMPLREAIGFDG